MAKITLKKVGFKGEKPAKTGPTARKTSQNLKKFLFWAEKSTFILHLRSYCAIILIYVNYCTGIRLRIRGIMSSTTYAKRTHYKPIDFFYRAVVDSKTKKVEFVDAFQILNDRYLGRMSVCNYFFIAENSVRINELNIIALDEMKNYHLVMRENFLIPEKVTYSLPITTRFLEKDTEFEVLVASLKENGYKKGSLVISLNSTTIMRLDQEAKKRYDRLRRMGYKICINGFGEEFNSLDVFARYTFDYLRLEASYFDATPSKKKILNMLVKHCKANKIGLIMEGVDSPAQNARFKKEGVKFVTGKAVSKLSRYVTNEFLNLPAPTGEKKEALLKKLEKDLAEQDRKEQAEYDALVQIAKDKARQDAASGKVSPVAPRPELIKSPYQVRLEQQKQIAKRAAMQRAQENAGKAPRENMANPEARERRLMEEASHGMFEGTVQSMLATKASQDAKKKKADKQITPDTRKMDKLAGEYSGSGLDGQLGNGLDGQGGMGFGGFGGAPVIPAHEEAPAPAESKPKKSTKKPANPVGKIETPAKPKKDVVADTRKMDKLAGEYGRKSSLDEQLGMSGAMGGFGVTLTFGDKESGEEMTGHYNEAGQWIDEEGYVYNGYFDENGQWKDYEAFNSSEEGSYNDQGQWVDKDGKVYDGYFDEEGRWIDYTYVNEQGEKVDNGYFDNKIGKWIPFGYFDESGNWQEYK